jgi:hypothetical protein
MPSYVAVEQLIEVGHEVVIEVASPNTPYLVVFEDDGETGYFYAIDASNESSPIQDALHIYNVTSITDKSKPATVQVVLSSDGEKALLLINQHPHGAFNFSTKQGFCRSAFPVPRGEWSKLGHNWNDSILEFFR